MGRLTRPSDAMRAKSAMESRLKHAFSAFFAIYISFPLFGILPCANLEDRQLDESPASQEY